MAIISTLGVSIRAKADQFLSAMKKVRATIGRVTGAMGRIAKSIGPVIAAFLGLSGISLIGLIQQTRTLADEVAKMAAEIGIGIDELFALRKAAELTGSSTDVMNKALQRMNRRIGEAARGYGEAVKGLDNLGLSADKLADMTAFEQFKTISDRISNLGTQALKAGDAYTLFGRQGQALVNMMALQSAGLDEVLKRTRRLQGSFSTMDFRGIEAMNDRIVDLKTALEGVSLRALIGLAPQISGVIVAVTDGFIALRERILPALLKQQQRFWEFLLNAVNKVFPVLFMGWITARELGKRFWIILKAIGRGFAVMITGIGKAVLAMNKFAAGADILKGLGIEDLATALVGVVSLTQRMQNSILEAFKVIAKIPGTLVMLWANHMKNLFNLWVTGWKNMLKFHATWVKQFIEVGKAAFDPDITLADAMKTAMSEVIQQAKSGFNDVRIAASRVSLDPIKQEVGLIIDQFKEIGIALTEGVAADVDAFKKARGKLAGAIERLRDFHLEFDLPQIGINPEDQKLLKRLFAPAAEFGTQEAHKIIAQAEGLRDKVVVEVDPDDKLKEAVQKMGVAGLGVAKAAGEQVKQGAEFLANKLKGLLPKGLLAPEPAFPENAKKVEDAIRKTLPELAKPVTVDDIIRDEGLTITPPQIPLPVLPLKIQLPDVTLSHPRESAEFLQGLFADFGGTVRELSQVFTGETRRRARETELPWTTSGGRDRHADKANEAIPKQNDLLRGILDAVKQTAPKLALDILVI